MNPDTAVVNVRPGTAIVNGTVVPAESKVAMIRPIATPDEALDAWNAFQALKAKLVTADDIQIIQGNRTTKKSGWRKIGAAFGLDYELIREERIEHTSAIGSLGFAVEATVRAIAPNGRHADGVGSCDSTESRFKKNADHLEHDVRSTAYTRACNRAISDLVGGGEVSAEELKADAKPVLSREQAAELLTQFDHSCDNQHVNYDYRTLCVQLLQSADDLRRAFKYFKEQGTPWVQPQGQVEGVADHLPDVTTEDLKYALDADEGPDPD